TAYDTGVIQRTMFPRYQPGWNAGGMLSLTNQIDFHEVDTGGPNLPLLLEIEFSAIAPPFVRRADNLDRCNQAISRTNLDYLNVGFGDRIRLDKKHNRLRNGNIAFWE